MIKIKEDNKCETCNLPEDVEHVVFKCQKYDNARNHLNINRFNNFTQMYLELGESTIEKLADFIRASNLTM
jgi:hypothetical protein